MKKSAPLVFLIILVSLLPHVRADIESLYVDSYTGDLANWDERNAPSPYLADEDTGFIHEAKTGGATEGYFGFADSSGSGTINSVTLYVECYGDDTDESLDIYVDCSDGGGWVMEGNIPVDQTSYGWETLVLSSRLDSWLDIQNAQIYFSYVVAPAGDDVYVRRAYLYVDYTPAGDEYVRELSQQISYTGVSYRTCDLKRDTSQGLTISGDSYRGWSLTRTFTQLLSFTASAVSDIIQNILVQLSQGINIGSNAFSKGGFNRFLSETLSFSSGIEKSLSAIRNPTQSITTSIECLRNWILERKLAQSITTSVEALKNLGLTRYLSQSISLSTASNAISNYIRNIQQGLSFTVESFVQFLAGGGEAFYRTITMGLDIASNLIRRLSITRIVGQSISIDSSTWDSHYEELDQEPSPHGVIIIQTEQQDEPVEKETNPYITEVTIIIIGSVISYIYKRRRM